MFQYIEHIPVRHVRVISTLNVGISRHPERLSDSIGAFHERLERHPTLDLLEIVTPLWRSQPSEDRLREMEGTLQEKLGDKVKLTADPTITYAPQIQSSRHTMLTLYGQSSAG